MNNLKWFRGLRGRLTVIMIMTTVCISILNIVAYRGSQSVTNSISAITKIRMPSIKGLEAMNEGQTAVMQTLALIENHQENDPQSKQNLEKTNQRYQDKRKQIRDGFNLYAPLPQTPDEEEEYKNTFLRVWKEWEDACDAYIYAKQKGDHALATQHYAAANKTFWPSETSLGKIIAINYKNAENDRSEAETSLANMISLTLTFGLIGLIFIVVFSIIVAVRTTATLSHLSFKLSESSSHVASSSTQIAASSEELSLATTQQASSLQETASSLEQISAMITKASENATLTSDRSTESHQKAMEGRIAADQVVSSMDEINQSNEAIMKQIIDSNQQMSEIIKVIQEIGSKTKVINEIVFQTKLLSFNASVEAARAGEHGKGFAIVAEEVGNLAEMSGSAAKEISDMLASSITKVEDIVSITKTKVDSLAEQGRMKIINGVDVAKKCSNSLSEIVNQVSKVTSLAHEISYSTKEQSQGIIEINKAMAQLDSFTHKNAGTSQESASAAEELSLQAEALKNAVQDLVLTIEGQSKTHRSVPTTHAQKRKFTNSTSHLNLIRLNNNAPRSSKDTFITNSHAYSANNKTPNRDDVGFKEI